MFAEWLIQAFSSERPVDRRFAVNVFGVHISIADDELLNNGCPVFELPVFSFIGVHPKYNGVQGCVAVGFEGIF